MTARSVLVVCSLRARSDRVLVALARAAGMGLIVRCDGDRHIDDHHTAEDVAITVGQCLFEALGDKAGLARMGCAEGASGAAHVRAVMDLSNRPHFESDLPLDEELVGDGRAPTAAPASHGGAGDDADGAAACGGVLSCEMLFHVFLSLTLEARATCHLELRADCVASGHTLDVALAAAQAYGAALARAMRVDPRRRGAVASSKGTLSA
jgi:imidazoleglycerol-phosphate dehydratase